FKCHSEQNCWIHVERKKEFVIFREIVQHGVLVQWVVPECRRNKYQRNPQQFNSHNQQRSKADTVSPLRVRTVPPYALDFARKGRAREFLWPRKNGRPAYPASLDNLRHGALYRALRRTVIGMEPSGRGATFQESSSPFIS